MILKQSIINKRRENSSSESEEQMNAVHLKRINKMKIQELTQQDIDSIAGEIDKVVRKSLSKASTANGPSTGTTPSATASSLASSPSPQSGTTSDFDITTGTGSPPDSTAGRAGAAVGSGAVKAGKAAWDFAKGAYQGAKSQFGSNRPQQAASTQSAAIGQMANQLGGSKPNTMANAPVSAINKPKIPPVNLGAFGKQTVKPGTNTLKMVPPAPNAKPQPKKEPSMSDLIRQRQARGMTETRRRWGKIL